MHLGVQDFLLCCIAFTKRISDYLKMRTSSLLWKVAFLFLVISGAIGVLMRWQFISPINAFNYQYLLHTHSHVVLLGWVFNAIIAGFHFILFKDSVTKRHLILYLMFQVSVLGMLLSFPIQGYAAISISFSTLHILLSYAWTRLVWKKSKVLNFEAKSFIRWGLFYLVLSTLGPFSLGPIIVSGHAGSNLYYMAIYFYLHFLYNGFFIFSIIGMFFSMVQAKPYKIDPSDLKVVLRLMNVQCISGLALSALWMRPHALVYGIGAVAGTVQVVALIRFVLLIKPLWHGLTRKVSKVGMMLLKWCFSALVLKVFLQAISAIPFVAHLAYEVRNYTIGYLHLVFLGVVTTFLVAWFHVQGMMPVDTKSRKLGLAILFSGFILSELFIVTPTVWNPAFYFHIVFAGSVILWIGILLLIPVQNVNVKSPL